MWIGKYDRSTVFEKEKSQGLTGRSPDRVSVGEEGKGHSM